MKRVLQQISVMLLCLVISLMSIVPIQALDQTVPSDELIGADEKIYCDATIEDDFADDCVIVTLDRNLGGINKVHNISDFETTGIASIEDLTFIYYDTPEATAENSMISQIDETNFRQILKLKLAEPSKENVLRVVHELEQMDGIISANPSCTLQISGTIPNDSDFNIQWSLERIQVTEAWDITHGDECVRVGVIDNGIESHIDFGDNLVAGWDFYNENAVTNDDPLYGHGTRVAGIIGAQGNNEEGISGVAWDVTLIPLQITYDGINAREEDAVEAINYATNNNIPILNFSMSAIDPIPNLKQAIANYPGLVICAAGNQDEETESAPRNLDVAPSYPSSYYLSNVISVANSTQDDTLHSKSYYGKNHVHLAAPGTYIYTTHTFDRYTDDFEGTSLAAPHVTGVAALIKSIRPDLTALEIKMLILNNVDLVDALADKCITGGRLNADKAVLAASESQTFTGDVNGDGRSDMILSRHSGGKRALTVYLGKTTGGFEEPITTQSTRHFAYHHTAFSGDFNGDGKTDILIQWVDGNDHRQLLVYISKGDGTFYEGANLSSTRLYKPNDYPSKDFVADVNGDGKDDFVVHWRTTEGNRAALVYKGTASSPYLIDTPYNALTSDDPYKFEEAVLMGDFNGDGYDDMLVHGATTEHKRRLLIYTGRSDANFNTGVELISTRNHYPQHFPLQLFVSDVNADGKDDLIVHYSNGNTKRSNLVYKGTSASPYLIDASTDALTSENNYVYSDPVFVGDFNGDNYSDMLVHWSYYDTTKMRQLLLYTANSDGTYDLGVNQSTSNTHNPLVYAGSFFVADVNGDGRDDFIVKWKSGTNVAFLTYLGLATGGFSAAVRTTPATNIPYFNGT